MNYLCVSVSAGQSSQFSSRSGEHLLGPWSPDKESRESCWVDQGRACDSSTLLAEQQHGWEGGGEGTRGLRPFQYQNRKRGGREGEGRGKGRESKGEEVSGKRSLHRMVGRPRARKGVCGEAQSHNPVIGRVVCRLSSRTTELTPVMAGREVERDPYNSWPTAHPGHALTPGIWAPAPLSHSAFCTKATESL